MATSILGVIQHYQRSIEHSQDDESRLLHCINKLYKLPVKVEHLQETGIGKTVNSLRKYNGEIGVAAKALVTKWKAMVAAEEEPMETQCQTTEHTSTPASRPDSSEDERSNHQSKQDNSPKAMNNHSSRSGSTHKSSERSEKRDKPRDSHKESSHERHSSKSKREKNGETSSGKQHKSSDREQTEKSRHQHSSAEKEKHKSHSSKHEKSESSHRSDANGVRNALKEQHRHSEKSKERKPDKHSEREQHSSDSMEKEKNAKESEKPKHHKNEHSKSASKDQSTDKHKSHKSSSSKHKSHSSHSSSTKPTTGSSSSKSAHKRSHSAPDSDEDRSSPEQKKPKTQKPSKPESMAVEGPNEGEPEDGIDSSMGANFADVLGMLNIPSKKSKKSVTALKSPNTNATSVTKTSTNHPTASTSSRKVTNDKSPNTASTSRSAKLITPDEKPALLTSAAKLEPLDPSIVLELPTISTNYKPLPINQTVMECVYNNFSNASVSTKPPPRMLSDAEAYSHGISSKTIRTKIYSGVKTGQIHQVPPLFDLCIRVLQKNIDALEYTGGVPFEVLRPVLERATPQQLLNFEDYNPYLMEDSDVLWQIHVQRNYRNKKREEMESWREMFLRCEEEKEQKLNSLTASIKQSQKKITEPVRKTQLAFVDSMVKPPRNVQRKQEQYGTKAKMIATPAARVASLSSVTPNAAKVGDARLRVPVTARDAAQVSHAAVRPKKAPLMAKTLQFMRGRHKR